MSPLSGEIYDLAVDMRRNSPHYGRYVGEYLSETNHRLLYIPAGFAHGLCVVSEEADVVYGVTNEYSSVHERGVIWNDLSIRVRWPVPQPILSEGDGMLPTFDKAENNF